MNAVSFKLVVGGLFLLSHFVSIGIIVFNASKFGDDLTELASHVLIIGSFTTFLAVAYFKYLFGILRTPDADSGLTFDMRPAGVIIFVCTLAALSLILMVNYLLNQTDFKTVNFRLALGTYESVIGVFLGFAGEALFQAQKPAKPEPEV